MSVTIYASSMASEIRNLGGHQFTANFL